MYLLIAANRDLLGFFNHYYFLFKKMFSEVITILHLRELLSSNKVIFNIIKPRLISKLPLSNMLVVVLSGVLELRVLIKSLIVSSDKIV